MGKVIDLGKLEHLGPDAFSLVQDLIDALSSDSEGGKKLTKGELRYLGGKLLKIGAKLVLGMKV